LWEECLSVGHETLQRWQAGRYALAQARCAVPALARMNFLFYFADLIVCAKFATRANVGIAYPD
jgi:hypothetical protein